MTPTFNPPTTVSNALDKQDGTPSALVLKYEDRFAAALPSHITIQQWLAVAQGALNRDSNIKAAAENNPGVFLSALMTAARLGLEPGTEQYYLVPQPPKAGAPPEILGVVGWQGMVELIYRAGAVSSVIAEVVRSSDDFDYQPGIHDRPHHRIDWKLADRGNLELVYAYAIMKDRAVSKVVVLNKADINTIMAASKSAKSEYSPWKRYEAAMWLKSAVRQLAKWVPTSAEYRREQLRAVQQVAAEQQMAPHHVNPVTGEVLHDDLIEAQIVD